MNIIERFSPKYFKQLFRMAIGRIRLEMQLRQATPVFVYQMGKVGSKSIHESLLQQYPGVVLHGHNFFLVHSSYPISRLYRWAVQQGKPLYVISLTREPLSRNVSAFFQNFEVVTGVEYEKSNFTLDELRAIFLSNYPHDVPLKWFDENILENFGIDVYATPFPPSGFATYSHRNIKLLVMRSEISDDEKAKAVRDFLQLPDFRLVNSNLSESKNYAMTYKIFIKNIKLPVDYIETMCRSKYFTHFYSEDEISNVRAKWS